MSTPATATLDGVRLAQQTLDSLVAAVEARCARGAYFTQVGPLLVALHPAIGWNVSDADMLVHAARLHAAMREDVQTIGRPPRRTQAEAHLCDAIATAYREAVCEHKGCTLVFTGESGSGKTEALQLALRCLGITAGAATPTVQHRVNAVLSDTSSRILTAAADAHTVLHTLSSAQCHSSAQASRGGILVQAAFSRRGVCVSADIHTSLVDKWRVAHSHTPEHTSEFTILTALRYGTPPEVADSLGLSYTSLPSYVQAATDGAAAYVEQQRRHFTALVTAFARLGIHEGMQLQIYRVCAAALLLCELACPVAGISLSELTHLLTAASANLGVSPDVCASAVWAIANEQVDGYASAPTAVAYSSTSGVPSSSRSSITAGNTSRRRVSRGIPSTPCVSTTSGATSRRGSAAQPAVSASPAAIASRIHGLCTGLGVALYTRVWLYVCAAVRIRLHALAESACAGARREMLATHTSDSTEVLTQLYDVLAPVGWVALLDGPGAPRPHTHTTASETAASHSASGASECVYESGDVLCGYWSEKIQQLHYEFGIAAGLAMQCSQGHAHPTLTLSGNPIAMSHTHEHMRADTDTSIHAQCCGTTVETAKIAIPSAEAVCRTFTGGGGVPTSLLALCEECGVTLHPSAYSQGLCAGTMTHHGGTSGICEYELPPERSVSLLVAKLGRTGRICAAPGTSSRVVVTHSHAPIVYSPRGLATHLCTSVGCEASQLRCNSTLGVVPSGSVPAVGAGSTSSGDDLVATAASVLPREWSLVPATLTRILARATTAPLVSHLLPPVIELADGAPVPTITGAAAPAHVHVCGSAVRCLQECIDTLLSGLAVPPHTSPVFPPIPSTRELHMSFIRCVALHESTTRDSGTCHAGDNSCCSGTATWALARQLAGGYAVPALHLATRVPWRTLPWPDFYSEYIILAPEVSVGPQLPSGDAALLPIAALLHRLVTAWGDTRVWVWPPALDAAFVAIEAAIGRPLHRPRGTATSQPDALLGYDLVFLSAALVTRAAQARAQVCARQDAAARCIQARVRGALARMNARRRTTAAVVLQTWVRSRCRARAYTRFIRAVHVVIATLRAWRARAAFLRGRSAVVALQRRYRRRQLMLHAAALSSSLFRLHALARAALLRGRIQRVSLSRSVVTDCVLDWVQRQRAAASAFRAVIALQAAWRGRFCRRSDAGRMTAMHLVGFRCALFRVRLIARLVAARKAAPFRRAFCAFRPAALAICQWWRARSLAHGYKRFVHSVCVLQRCIRRFLTMHRLSLLAAAQERAVTASFVSVLMSAEGRTVIPLHTPSPSPYTRAGAFATCVPLDLSVSSPGVFADSQAVLSCVEGPVWGRVSRVLAEAGATSGIHTVQCTRDGMHVLTTDGRVVAIPWSVASTVTPSSLSHIGLRVPVTQLACGWHHSVVRLANGTCMAWGTNTHGECGIVPHASTMHITRPTSMPLDSIVKYDVAVVRCGAYHTLLLTGRGGVFACGEATGTGRVVAPVAVPSLSASASASVGTVRQLVGLHHTRVVDIACGWHHNCARDERGDVYCWGDNRASQCGVPSSLYTAVPEPLRVVLPAAASAHSSKCTEGTSAGVEACMGAMPIAVLSGGVDTSSHTTRVGDVHAIGEPLPPQSSTSLLRAALVGNMTEAGPDSRCVLAGTASRHSQGSIACGARHTVAICGSSGRVFVWGTNAHGECGLPIVKRHTSGIAPTLLPLTHALTHTAAAGTDGMAPKTCIPVQVAAGAHATYVLMRSAVCAPVVTSATCGTIDTHADSSDARISCVIGCGKLGGALQWGAICSDDACCSHATGAVVSAATPVCSVTDSSPSSVSLAPTASPHVSALTLSDVSPPRVLLRWRGSSSWDAQRLALFASHSPVVSLTYLGPCAASTGAAPSTGTDRAFTTTSTHAQQSARAAPVAVPIKRR